MGNWDAEGIVEKQEPVQCGATTAPALCLSQSTDETIRSRVSRAATLASGGGGGGIGAE
jgi:hypothetical protein